MREDPASAGRRRGAETVSLGIVAGAAWTLGCLVLLGDAPGLATAMALWLAGLGAIAGATGVLLRLRARRGPPPRRRR